ncbi:MAG: hypothetical protein ABIQ00_00020 [Chitinophagaceae bacterium]
MINKAEKFYRIAKKEGRTRGDNDRTPAPVEEEYRTDSIIILLLFSFLFLIVSFFILN